MQRSLYFLLPGLLAGGLLQAPMLRAQEIAAIVLFKAAWYEQDTADDPVLFPPADDPYDLTSTVYLSEEVWSDPDWELWITGVTFRTPGGRTEGMFADYELGGFGFYSGAVSSQALNLRYGAGTYRFTLSSVITGNTVYNLPVTADDYPPAPKITNFNAAQKVDATQDFVLRWVAFPGDSEREIWLNVVDDTTFEAVFSAGPLDPSETSVTIPAGTFTAETTYWARLAFTRYTHFSASTVPSTYSGFESYNNFPLKAVAGGSSPDPSTITGYRLLPNGDFELTVSCAPSRPLTLQGAAILGGSWSNLQTSLPDSSPVVLLVPKASLGDRIYLRLFQD